MWGFGIDARDRLGIQGEMAKLLDSVDPPFWLGGLGVIETVGVLHLYQIISASVVSSS